MGFQGFSRFWIGFSRFKVGFEGKSWLQVGFIVTGRYFMVPGGFSCFFIAPGLVFMMPGGFVSLLMVPGWFNSELSEVRC